MRASEDTIDWLYRTINFKYKLFSSSRLEVKYSAIVALIHADLNNRHFDLSSFAQWAGLPRTSCARMIKAWEQEDLCVRERTGRRVIIRPTEKAHALMADFIEYLRRNPFPSE